MLSQSISIITNKQKPFERRKYKVCPNKTDDLVDFYQKNEYKSRKNYPKTPENFRIKQRKITGNSRYERYSFIP